MKLQLSSSRALGDLCSAGQGLIESITNPDCVELSGSLAGAFSVDSVCPLTRSCSARVLNGSAQCHRETLQRSQYLMYVCEACGLCVELCDG